MTINPFLNRVHIIVTLLKHRYKSIRRRQRPSVCGKICARIRSLGAMCINVALFLPRCCLFGLWLRLLGRWPRVGTTRPASGQGRSYERWRLGIRQILPSGRCQQVCSSSKTLLLHRLLRSTLVPLSRASTFILVAITTATAAAAATIAAAPGSMSTNSTWGSRSGRRSRGTETVVVGGRSGRNEGSIGGIAPLTRGCGGTLWGLFGTSILKGEGGAPQCGLVCIGIATIGCGGQGAGGSSRCRSVLLIGCTGTGHEVIYGGRLAGCEWRSPFHRSYFRRLRIPDGASDSIAWVVVVVVDC